MNVGRIVVDPEKVTRLQSVRSSFRTTSMQVSKSADWGGHTLYRFVHVVRSVGVGFVEVQSLGPFNPYAVYPSDGSGRKRCP